MKRRDLLQRLLGLALGPAAWAEAADAVDVTGPSRTSNSDDATAVLALGILAARQEMGSVMAEVWLRAAQEMGLPAMMVADDQLLQDLFHGRQQYAALVLPDGILTRAGPEMVAGLFRYVEQGGRLLVTFDAATLTAEGYFAPLRSRLSALVGVDYAMYDDLRDQTTRNGVVYASPETARLLALPPGKFVPDPHAASATFNLRLATYGYANLIYPSFTTGLVHDAEPLLLGPGGQWVAGIRRSGRGTVIFANIPLGGMKLLSDGWLLGRFLRLLGEQAGLPMLAATPDAIGGMVMNLHVDSNAALPPLLKMEQSGFFDQGRCSVHVTAGPGLNTASDGLGIDVAHHPEFQRWLRLLVKRGHEIGDHGGWIHNHWALEVTEESEQQDQSLLELNTAALTDAIHQPVRVYSSPGGNHPIWLTRWLKGHGFVAWYQTSNCGSAPTRNFRQGVLEDGQGWSFPIASYGMIASFEEAARLQLDEASVVTPWLEQLTEFSADQHEVRLVYFHPTGIEIYREALAAWRSKAQELATAGRFRWYTMGGLADFLNQRELVTWQMVRHGEEDWITARHNTSLATMAWLIPAAQYAKPRMIEGVAEVRRGDGHWIVQAREGRRLVLACPRLTPAHDGPGA